MASEIRVARLSRSSCVTTDGLSSSLTSSQCTASAGNLCVLCRACSTPSRYDPGSLRPHPIRRVLLAPLAAIGLTACGVAFSSTFNGTEMFKGIAVSGDMVEGAELTVTVTVAPVYPIPVELACYYEDDDTVSDDMAKIAFHDRALLAGKTTVEAAAEGVTPSDNEKAPRQEFSFRFTPPAPGDYFIACLTPAAPDNGIGVDFTVKPRS